MERVLMRALQFQIADQCRFGILALADAQTQPPGVRFWYGMQNLLVAAANISKALWGQGGKFTKEREPLRASLQVTDSSPLRATTMRNHWEHYDERLFKWAKESKNHNYVDQNVGALNLTAMMVGSQPDEIDVFRHFDDTTGVLHFWGDKFPLIR